jgi:hypothetical protein
MILDQKANFDAKYSTAGRAFCLNVYRTWQTTYAFA